MADSFSAIISRRPKSPALLDLTRLEDVEFPFVPNGFQREISPRWESPNRQGSASNPIHYDGTSNQVIKISMDVLIERPGQYEAVRDFIAFLEAGMVPEDQPGARNRSPSTYLLYWPGEFSLAVVVDGFSDEATMFFQNGSVRMRTVSITFRELVDGVLLKDEVRSRGSVRNRIFT